MLLQDGANSIDNTHEAHKDTIGCHSTNDSLAESVFGTYDMMLRRFPGISMEAASGVAQAVRSKVLLCGDHVARRKAATRVQQDPWSGLFRKYPEHEQEALVELARRTVDEYRNLDRADHAALDEYHKHRRKTNEENELDALFSRYALALSFFDRWAKRGVASMSEVTSALRGYGNSEQVSSLATLILARTPSPTISPLLTTRRRS